MSASMYATGASRLAMMQDTTSWVAGPFDYQRLDAGRIAREAFEAGMAIARAIPKGNATLVDQLVRALQSAFLNVAEAASKTGADRSNRFRIAKGSASEAAAAIDAAVILGLAAKPQADRVTYLLARLCAMLTRLTRT